MGARKSLPVGMQPRGTKSKVVVPVILNVSEMQPCYDCGSTIKGHHTELCEMAGPRDKRDLPSVPKTQWWTESAGVKRRQAAGELK